MKLVNQAMILKELGFHFAEIGRGNTPIYVKGSITILLSKSSSRADLVRSIDHATAAGRKYDNLIANRKAQRRRRLIRMVNGGMAWAPTGLRTGAPQGKLKLVKVA
jgi:hypothetical protein